MKVLKTSLLASLLVMIALAVQAGTTRITSIIPDASGSPVVAMNQAGDVIWRKTYTPYGKASNKDHDNRIGFTGHVEDQNGLVYAGNRYYDPGLERFLSDDPLRFNEKNPMSFGRYTYGNNNPYRYTDPTGMAPEDWRAIGEEPPSAALTQASENIAAGANTTAEMVDSVMPHSVGDVALQAMGMGVLSKFAKGITNPAIAKLARPVIPEGMTQSRFGKEVIGWGSGAEAAAQRTGTITSDAVVGMKQQGLTEGMATQWRDFYSNEFSRNANNHTAENRAELMQKVLDNF